MTARHRWTCRNIAALALPLLLAACAAGPVAPRLTELAQFPPGNFLENGDQAADGTLYFTSYFERRLYAWKDGAGVRVVAELPVHPVAVLATADGFLLTAHGTPFTSGPAFAKTNQLLLLDRAGEVAASTAAPDARFLNGMARLEGSTVLIADSIAGTVWRFDTSTRALAPWLQHELLTQDPASKVFKPGANGVKRRGQSIIVSNSSRGTLVRVPLAGLAAGTPAVIAAPGAIDDFALAGDGSVYVATHGDALTRVLADGSLQTVLPTGCGGCTAVFVDRASPGNALLILTTGGLLEGRKEPAKLLRLDLH